MPKRNDEIVLLNVEGPLLKVKKAHEDEYVLYDYEDSIVDILNCSDFIDFIYNKKAIIFTDGREIKYNDFAPRDRANKAEVARFIFGIDVSPYFINLDKIDGQWLSPIPTEREWQIETLKDLFPSYPNGAPRWQYLNGLLQIAIEYKKQIESEEESEEDENG